MKKKREKVKGRARAVICMILLIVLSIPIGSGLSLARAREKVNEHFYGSYDTYGLLADLAGCSRAAANMATIAGKYTEAGSKELAGVREWGKKLDAAQSPSEKAKAYDELTVQTNALYHRLNAIDMTEEDLSYLEENYADFLACADMISYNDYNAAAAKFNEKFQNSPAKTIGMLMGVTELEPFA